MALYIITGAIGSGKSAAAQIFEELGGTIIDADGLARQAVHPGTKGYNEVVNHFGKEFVDSSGKIDRAKLAKEVFQHPEQRKSLEAIVHPIVRELFYEKLAACPKSAPVFYVVPLYYESGRAIPEADGVITIWAEKKQCLNRASKRDGATAQEISQRYEAQLPIEEKVKRADYVVDNRGSADDLRAEAERVYQLLRVNETLLSGTLEHEQD